MQSSRKLIFLSNSLRSSCLPISQRTSSKCLIVAQFGAMPKKSKTQQKEQAIQEKKLNLLLLMDRALLYSQMLDAISISQLYSLYFIMMIMAAMKVLNSPPIQERVSSYFLKDREIVRERLDFLTQRVTYSVIPLVVVGLNMYLCVASYTIPPLSWWTSIQGHRLSSVSMLQAEMKMLADVPIVLVNWKQLRSQRQKPRQSDESALIIVLTKQQLNDIGPLLVMFESMQLSLTHVLLSPGKIEQLFTDIFIYWKIVEVYFPVNQKLAEDGRHSQLLSPIVSQASPREGSKFDQTVRLQGINEQLLVAFLPLIVLFCDNSILKYLKAGSLRLQPESPSAKRKGESVVVKQEGSVSSKSVVCDEMLTFSKVLRIVWVKIMEKPIMTAMEQSPPLADLYQGFSLYRMSSVVLKRSHTLTRSLVFLNALLKLLPTIQQKYNYLFGIKGCIENIFLERGLNAKNRVIYFILAKQN